jgi:hypothetical protein
LRFERDEQEDYWLYPFAKALWLAIDLVFRPVQPEDLR